MRGRTKGPNTTMKISGQSLARPPWGFAGLVAQGIQAGIAKKLYIFVIFQGGGGGSPSGSAYAGSSES